MELRDDAILLRPVSAEDAESFVLGCNDPDVARFIPLIPIPYTRAAADAWVRRCADSWRDGEAFPFAILDVDSGDFLGTIEVRPRGDVGYWIARDARGRGICTRALQLVCEWRSERPLWLTTHPANAGSRRVAEKAGFRRVGTVPHDPPFRDGLAEAILFRLD